MILLSPSHIYDDLIWMKEWPWKMQNPNDLMGLFFYVTFEWKTSKWIENFHRCYYAHGIMRMSQPIWSSEGEKVYFTKTTTRGTILCNDLMEW